MPDVIEELEQRLNGEILLGLKALYEKVGALVVPIEQSAASHIRTIIGEAHQAVTAIEKSPAAQAAIAVAEGTAAAPDQAHDTPVEHGGPLAAPVQAGAPVGTVAGAGQAPGGGPGDVLSTDTQTALNDLATLYEQERQRLIDAGSEKPAGGVTPESGSTATQTAAPALPALGAPDAQAGSGGSPTGAV